MVGVESLFRAERRLARVDGIPGRSVAIAGSGCFRTCKGGGQCRYIRTGCGFIQRDGCVVGIHPADVVPGFQGFLHHGVRLSGNGQQQGVKEVFVFNGDAGFRERLVQAFGFQVDFRADAFEAFLSVVYGVKGGKHGQEHLGGADVGGRLVAANMLFPRLQGQAVGRAAQGIYGHADKAAGHAAFESVRAGHVGGMGAAEAHWDAEALRVADADIGSEGAGFPDDGKGHEIRRHDAERARGMHAGKEVRVVADAAERVRILDKHSGQIRTDGCGVKG